MKKNSFMLPLILIIAAVVYLIWIWIIDYPGSVVIMSMPGISAVLCSAIAIILIKKYELNINQYLLMFVVTSVFSSVMAFLAFFAIYNLLCNIFNIDYYDIYEIISPVPSYVLLVFIPIVMIIVQFLLLNIKIKSAIEKNILIIINPVLHVLIWFIVLGLDLYIYFYC